MEDFGGYMVCIPETWEHTPDSVKDHCVECNGAVWVSRSARKLVSEHSLDLLCVFCAEIQEQKGEVLNMPPTPEQIRAAQREISRRAEKN